MTLGGRPDETLVVRVICGVGGVVNTISGTLLAGGVFPPDWLSIHINQKVYAIYHIYIYTAAFLRATPG